MVLSRITGTIFFSCSPQHLNSLRKEDSTSFKKPLNSTCYLLQQPKFVNSNKNTIMKNKIVLSPHPLEPNRLPKNPLLHPQLLLLLHPHPQSLVSSGILLPPLLIF